MTLEDEPVIDARILRRFFRSMSASNDTHNVDLDVYNYPEGIGFIVSLAVKEPDVAGCVPQNRIALEHHEGHGHPGIHLQIEYHKVDNPLNIGKLYLFLDISSDEEMVHVAEGFVYTLKEMMEGMGAEFGPVIEEIFDLPSLEGIADRKEVLKAKVQESYLNRAVDIVTLDREKSVLTGENLHQLLQMRKELVPLLGNLDETP